MKKTILALVLAAAMVLPGIPALAATPDSPAEAQGFTDISGHWAEAAIRTYADYGVFAGEGGAFSPDKPITRSEFVLLLHKALDIKASYLGEPDITELYDDVSKEDLFASELYDLAASGIISRRGSFRPHEALPREEMIHYIINALKEVTNGDYAIIQMMPAPFADDEIISLEYKDNIIEAVLLKIIYGRSGNMLYPREGATRAEAAVVVGRLMDTLDNLKGEPVEVTPSVEADDDGIKMGLTIVNNSGQPITINHSSGQKYDFVLLDSERNALYRWSADKAFIAALTTTVIEAGATLEFTELLEGEAYDGIKDEVKYMTAYIVGTSEAFSVNQEGYEAEIALNN